MPFQILGSMDGLTVRTLPSNIKTLAPPMCPLEAPISAVRPSVETHEGEAPGVSVWL